MEQTDSQCIASQLFDALKTTLSNVVGPTATATLLQRSIRRAAANRPDLTQLTIARKGFEYEYAVPSEWQREDRESMTALKTLLAELWPLLVELTGDVVVHQLRRVTPLGLCDILPKEAES